MWADRRVGIIDDFVMETGCRWETVGSVNPDVFLGETWNREAPRQGFQMIFLETILKSLT